VTPPRGEDIGIIGGTGPQGRGLGARWARAGHSVHLGSRSRDKAGSAAEELTRLVGADADVRPATNREAAERGELIVVAIPYAAQQATLPGLRDAAAGKVVVNVVNPMTFDEVGPRAVRVEAGSAAEECQQLWPEARVVSAFHEVPSRRLLRVDEPMACDALICSDDRDAAHRVAHLASDIPGMWAVDCGPLRNSEYLENLTPVILFINRSYKIHAGLRIAGIERDGDALHAEPGGRGAGRPR
jgi:NADPH-dependent F420 reductase